ncbi:MAG: hypothetical protein JRI68_26315 [Deltaproteobacteria bacterium]|nr:hypothetical protein [Deltaproteobacteria bacterium]
MRHPFALALATLLATAACSVPSARQDDGFDRERDGAEPAQVPRAADDAFYWVTRPDHRKCMWPLCGGVFVAQVNQAQTECLLGGSEPDCYVAQIDWSAVGLAPTELSEVDGQATQGHVLVRGHMESLKMQAHEAPVLVATGAWHAVTLNPPTGDFYYVFDNGITCVTFPCPSLTELRLNSSDTAQIAGLDLGTTGASQAQIQAGQSELAMDGLMVSANHQTVTGPAGEGQALAAVELYARLGSHPGEPCGNNVCQPTEFCCNPSCGICAPHGGACIEIACMPECGHDECALGDALTANCSPCATDVCAIDPYCCSTSWDQICVQEAGDLCPKCGAEPEPEPEPEQCTHDECATGAKLVSGCSECATTVCTADSYCCDTAWDALCVKEAGQLCGLCSEPEGCDHDECTAGSKLTPSCSSCAAAVCDADAYCCNTYWDSVCVQQAGQLCGC